jgi:triosephosphate isomerase
MEKIIVGNWKANISPAQADSWLQEFRRSYKPGTSVQVLLAVPFLYMERLGKAVAGMERISLAAQGVSPYPPGSYTGATPAAWLRESCSHVLIGHQERSRYFHEDTASLAAQVRETVAAGIRPILCLDSSNRGNRIAALDSSDLEQTLLAYTPTDAVRLEQAVSDRDINETAAALSGSGCPVLYGGGVNRDNAADLIRLQGISGIMVGRSCLDGAGFAALVNSITGM